MKIGGGPRLCYSTVGSVEGKKMVEERWSRQKRLIRICCLMELGCQKVGGKAEEDTHFSYVLQSISCNMSLLPLCTVQ